MNSALPYPELNILLHTCLTYWPNSLDCTDLNQRGAHRDAELCRLCYKQTCLHLLQFAKKNMMSNNV